MEQDWNARTTRRVGEEIAEARKRRGGMTAQGLADATAEAGYPIDRSVIAKIEKGLRQSISVAELVVIARALRVPPALLMYPVGRTEGIEFLPGETATPWAALRWFTGDGRVPLDNRVPKGEVDEETGLPEWYEDPEEGWEEGAAPVALWSQHSEQVTEWFDAPSVARRMGVAEQEERAERARLRGRVEEALKQTRATMRMRGLKPPRLPEDLSHVDQQAR
jgi:transcriptional regulator with XRE-family HTH domain